MIFIRSIFQTIFLPFRMQLSDSIPIYFSLNLFSLFPFFDAWHGDSWPVRFSSSRSYDDLAWNKIFW